MKYLKAAFASAMFGCITSAFAGAGVVTTSVTNLQDTVTYTYSKAGTKPLETYVGYKVTISTAGSNNTINNIRFSGTAAVTGSGATSAAAYFSAEGASCKTTYTATTLPSETPIECSIGQLTAGSQPRDIILFFRAPTGSGEGTASVVFSGRTYYAEGTGGANSLPENSISPPLSLGPATASVTLGTTNPVNIRTALPKRNVPQTIFTGDQGNPKPNPSPTLLTVFTESLTVPSLQNAATSYLTATVEIKQAMPSDPDLGVEYSNCLGAGNFVGCPAFTTKVLDANESPFVFADSDPLLFVLRVDASYLKRPPSKILNSVQLLYTGEYRAPDGTLLFNWVDEPVLACTNGQARTDGLPCVSDKFCYKNNYNVPDLRGDCEWQLKNKKNLVVRAR